MIVESIITRYHNIAATTLTANNNNNFLHDKLLRNKPLGDIAPKYFEYNIGMLQGKFEFFFVMSELYLNNLLFKVEEIFTMCIVNCYKMLLLVEEFRNFGSTWIRGRTNYSQETKIDNFSSKPLWYIAYKYAQRYIYFL